MVKEPALTPKPERTDKTLHSTLGDVDMARGVVMVMIRRYKLATLHLIVHGAVQGFL